LYSGRKHGEQQPAAEAPEQHASTPQLDPLAAERAKHQCCSSTDWRSTDRVRRALTPLGVADRAETVMVDVTDKVGVRAALDGCEAVIHAAAVYSFDPRRRREMIEGNVRGAELVLGAACDMDLDPVVQISSYVALLPGSPPLTADSPLGEPPTAYARSKARSEQVARELQAQGRPVTIVQPGMVWGPDDPALGESSQFARSAIKLMLPFAPPGSVPVVDVRDLAAVLAALLETGRGSRHMQATVGPPPAAANSPICTKPRRS
jgi:nucleoside-diphosphate-sugar epimerase